MPVTDTRPRRRLRRVATAMLACAALLTTACGEGGTVDETADQQPSASTTTPSPTSAAGTTTPSSPPAPAGTAVTTGDSEYGVMLFDQRNQAIYLFDAESDGTPACYDECAADWPPVLTEGTPQAAGQVQNGLLGTVQRNDGTTQLTYGGHPLYFYAHEDPGQVLCHDVEEYGGTWLVVTPEGSPAPA
jgi:predicted lipoprotein with Yx(FWY)xxD motif